MSNDIADTRKKLQQIAEGHLGQMADRAELDHEVQMARADLYKIGKYAIELHEMLKGISEEQGLEGWVQAKITKAADYIGSVKHHLEYQMAEVDMTPEAMPADALESEEPVVEDELEEEPNEGNEFTAARLAAIKAGKNSFTVDGKTYKVTGDTSDEEKMEESAVIKTKFSDWSKS